MLIKIKNQWRKWTQEYDCFLMACTILVLRPKSGWFTAQEPDSDSRSPKILFSLFREKKYWFLFPTPHFAICLSLLVSYCWFYKPINWLIVWYQYWWSKCSLHFYARSQNVLKTKHSEFLWPERKNQFSISTFWKQPTFWILALPLVSKRYLVT